MKGLRAFTRLSANYCVIITHIPIFIYTFVKYLYSAYSVKGKMNGG